MRRHLALGLLLAACADTTAHDAGARVDSGPDAGSRDAGGTRDAGSLAQDAGVSLGPDCVREIYASAETGAAPWYLGIGDYQDRIRQFGVISGEGRLTTVRASGQVRFTVLAEPSACEGEADHGAALARRYMCSQNDWRNFEMTGYLHVVTAAAIETDQDFTMYGNGGRHTGDGPPLGCLGSSYKGSYDYVQGRSRFAKESWHVLYDWTPWVDVAGGPDPIAANRFVGFKLVRYEMEHDGVPGVRLELWMDLGEQDAGGCPANEWTLIGSHEDHPNTGSWGSRATECNAPLDDQIMFWAGPWVTWRWDNTEAELRLMNVREIVPPVSAP